jgi:Ser/Thr protein kinase RdoA (MazF antagonist)
MIDFELAHLGPPEADISFALWVTGRTEQPAVTLDADRIRAFVTGYHRLRPLPAIAPRAIPLYLVGRGLQMHVRMERFGRGDEIQMQRLRWLHTHRQQLEQVVASALDAGSTPSLA